MNGSIRLVFEIEGTPPDNQGGICYIDNDVSDWASVDEALFELELEPGVVEAGAQIMCGVHGWAPAPFEVCEYCRSEEAERRMEYIHTLSADALAQAHAEEEARYWGYSLYTTREQEQAWDAQARYEAEAQAEEAANWRLQTEEEISAIAEDHERFAARFL